jgi:hypothetical protein
MPTEIKLRPREQQVANLLLRGYQNKDIAQELNMGYRTAKHYCERLFTKFGIEGGLKRVKLAVVLYGRYRCQEEANASHLVTSYSTVTEPITVTELSVSGRSELSDLSPKV